MSINVSACQRRNTDSVFPPGARARPQSGGGVPEDGVHVQGGDLLQGHPAAEGPGGRAGQEVQEGGDAGHRGRGQRREHD